jgi:large subunit ribosomal protein L6
MSRIGKQPIRVPSSVVVTVADNNLLIIKGPKGELSKNISSYVKIKVDEKTLVVSPVNSSRNANMQFGTSRALINNMIIGVSQGFEKRLQLFGVGYRAKVDGNTLNLTLGFSHTIDHKLSDSVTAETPSQTEIILKSTDKELLGRIAADIRAYRPPESYKGKGIRYIDERIVTKEAKKK